MTNVHSQQQASDGIHTTVAFSFASATARRAQSGLTTADIGRVAMQTDTTPCSLWAIVATASGTATWSRIDTGAEVTFGGNFASLFTGVLTSVQSDVGIVEGGTLKATGTSPPVLTFTGTRSGAPTPIKVTCTGAGARGTWTYAVSYDNGATTAMTGTSAATVALTGAGAGLTLNIATGSASTDNVWRATCATWTDQSAAGKNFTQATAGLQPVIAVGTNGKPCLTFDGSDDTMAAAVALPAPGTTPTTYLAAFRIDTWSSNTAIIGTDGFSLRVMMEGSSPQIKQGNSGGNLVTGGPAVGAFARLISENTNSVSDLLKFGSVQVSGTSAAEAAGSTSLNLATTGGLVPGAVSFLHFLALNNVPTGPQLSAYDAAIASFYSTGVGL